MSLAEDFSQSCSSIGAYFSTDSISENNDKVLPYVPQIDNPSDNFIDDSTKWKKIAGYFKAHGGEHYLYIGNFLNDINTVFENPPATNKSYVYIDNVQLYECDSLSSLQENSLKNGVKIYPNPTNANLSIELKSSLNKAYIELFDAMGRLVYTAPLNSSLTTLALPALPTGLYHARVWNNNTVIKQEKVVVY